MRKITKKVIKRIKAGYHDDLMEAIELLIDTYNEDKYDLGYQSCLDDMAVRGYRLAEYLHQESDKRGQIARDISGEVVTYLSLDETAQIIEEYFNNALNGE